MSTEEDTLLATLKSLSDRLRDQYPETPRARREFLRVAQDLALALEQPEDVVQRICYQPLETATVKIAVNLGIFDFLANATGCNSLEDIARFTKADPVLLARVVRSLAAHGAILETKPGSFDLLGPGWLKFPEHLKALNYQNPNDPKHTALSRALGITEKVPMQIFFESLHLPAFGLYMGTLAQGHKPWTDLYPVRERMINGFQHGSESVMMVDVGGGYGHQIELLREAFPDIPGDLIVQDLPAMQGPNLPGVEFMSHNFWTPQPIKGARAYYLRFIMHDYDFDRNVHILRHLKDAMAPEYSRLLINDWLIPEHGASRLMTIGDMNMMSLSGMEHTEKQHREIIEAAGLRITGIFRADDEVSESVIEAMVA